MKRKKNNTKEYMLLEGKTDLVHNWIGDDPVMSYEQARKEIGEGFTCWDFYDSFHHVGGTIRGDVDCIRITKEGAMDEYGVDIITKEPLKHFIDELQKIYDNYDEYYDGYVKNFRKRVWDMCDNIKEKRATYKAEMEQETDKEENGYIYVMLHQGYYKIGKSVDCMRLGEYTKLAEEPKYVIVQYVKHMSEMERKLHNVFSEKRCRSGSCEWFKLNKDDLRTIKDILNDDKKRIRKHTIGYRRYVLKEDV